MKPSWKSEWPWWVLFALAVWVLCHGYDAASLRFGRGILLAVLPILPGFALLWWMDRLPPLGARLWIRWIGWGLLVVPVVASNTHLMVAVMIEDWVENAGLFAPGDGATFGSLAGSILSAPVVEESLKTVLPLWLLCRRPALSGPWFSLLVGSIVALAFGWMENTVQFAGTGAKAVEASPESLFSTRFFFPYLHVVYSLPLLLAIGSAVFLPTLSRRIALISVGWLGSIALHGLWNWEVLFGHSELSVAPGYPDLAWVSPLVVLAVLLLVHTREAKILARAGVTVPRLLQRFRGADPEAIQRARAAHFDRFLELDSDSVQTGAEFSTS